MDIARDDDGGVVIQYVNRADFERAIAPLPAPAESAASPKPPTPPAAAASRGDVPTVAPD
jgi:hypothetical protein